MKKIDKKVADAYFREKNRYMFVYFALWFLVSFVVVAFADSLTEVLFLGFPFHYFMGAIGALFTFIVLLLNLFSLMLFCSQLRYKGKIVGLKNL